MDMLASIHFFANILPASDIHPEVIFISFCFCFSKYKPELLSAVNSALIELEQENILTNIYDKWWMNYCNIPP